MNKKKVIKIIKKQIEKAKQSKSISSTVPDTLHIPDIIPDEIKNQTQEIDTIK